MRYAGKAAFHWRGLFAIRILETARGISWRGFDPAAALCGASNYIENRRQLGRQRRTAQRRTHTQISISIR